MALLSAIQSVYDAMMSKGYLIRIEQVSYGKPIKRNQLMSRRTILECDKCKQVLFNATDAGSVHGSFCVKHSASQNVLSFISYTTCFKYAL